MPLITAFITTTVTLAATLAPACAAAGLVTFLPARAGTLSITAPATAVLGSAPPGGGLTLSLGTVTVTDTRSPNPGAWTATVSSTDYTRTSPPAAVINKANMSYWSGPATATQGGGTYNPGQPTAAAKVNLSVPRTAFSRNANAGVNSASWAPTVQLSIPINTTVITGTYTGTITHSVG